MDWRTAAHHYWMAGDRTKTHGVIDSAAKDILAKGEYSLTEAYIPDSTDGPGGSRASKSFDRAATSSAATFRARSRRAQRAAEIEPQSSIALFNLASFVQRRRLQGPGPPNALAGSSRARAIPAMKELGESLVAVIDSSLDGNVRPLVLVLRSVANEQHQSGATHFEGIAYLEPREQPAGDGRLPWHVGGGKTSIDLLTASLPVRKWRRPTPCGRAQLLRCMALSSLRRISLGPSRRRIPSFGLTFSTRSETSRLVRECGARRRSRRGAREHGRQRRLGTKPDLRDKCLSVAACRAVRAGQRTPRWALPHGAV